MESKLSYKNVVGESLENQNIFINPYNSEFNGLFSMLLPYQYQNQPQLEIYQYDYQQQEQEQEQFQNNYINKNDLSLLYLKPIQNYLQFVNNPNFYIHNDRNAIFLMIKSFNEANIIYAIQQGIWCSTLKGNQKLNQLYLNNPFTPIYLFFSVNESGFCQGFAQMKSQVDFTVKYPIQSQQNKWKGIFCLQWIYIKTIANDQFRKIKNDMNQSKPFTNSRDCQEISFEAGYKAYQVFKHNQTQNSFLNQILNIEGQQEDQQQQSKSENQ